MSYLVNSILQKSAEVNYFGCIADGRYDGRIEKYQQGIYEIGCWYFEQLLTENLHKFRF